MGDDRPSVYEDQGKFIYRASSLGGCIRGLVAARLGMEAEQHPDWLLKRFDEGHTLEPELIEYVRVHEWHGYRMKPLDPSDRGSYAGLAHITTEHDGQFVGEIPVGSNAIVRVHLDGIGLIYSAPVDGELAAGSKCVIEVKALGPDYWKKWKQHGIEGFPGYLTQLTIEMEAAGLPGLFVVGRKDRDGEEGEPGKVVEYDSMLFYHPPGRLTDVKLRVMKVEQMASKGVLVECDQKQYPCQWFYTGGACSMKAGEKKGEDGEYETRTTILREGHKLIPEFHRAINNLAAATNKIKAGENEKAAANHDLTVLITVAREIEAPDTFSLREEPVGGVRLPDGTSVVDTVYLNKGGVREVKPYWVRYPKVN